MRNFIFSRKGSEEFLLSGSKCSFWWCAFINHFVKCLLSKKQIFCPSAVQYWRWSRSYKWSSTSLCGNEHWAVRSCCLRVLPVEGARQLSNSAWQQRFKHFHQLCFGQKKKEISTSQRRREKCSGFHPWNCLSERVTKKKRKKSAATVSGQFCFIFTTSFFWAWFGTLPSLWKREVRGEKLFWFNLPNLESAGALEEYLDFSQEGNKFGDFWIM